MSCPSNQIKYGLNGVASSAANTILKSVNENSNKNIQPKCYKNILDCCLDVAKGLVQRQAFYTLDFADVLWKVQMWKSQLPNVEIFYAVKANDDHTLLRLLTLLDLSFDCSCQAEIQKTLDAGAAPSKIIFAHTIKTKEELEYAAKMGVDLMTFDNEDELYKIQRVFPNARLVLRLSPAEVKCRFDLSDKFGCSLEDAMILLETAQKLKLNVVGISFHVGSLCPESRCYTSTIRECRWLFDKAAEKGFKFSILDIGGGFFGSTVTEDIFPKVSEDIAKALEEYFPDNNVRIIAEPGTYMVCSAVNLVCTILGKKTVKCEGEAEPKRYYYVNEGRYGSFFKDILTYDITLIPLLPESEFDVRKSFPTKIFGQTCCSEDVLPFNGPLKDMKVGELVMWDNMGAYTRGIATTFCGALFPMHIPVFVKNQRLNLEWIVNREAIRNFLKERASFIGCGASDI